MIDSFVEKKSILQAIKVLEEVTEKYYNDSSKKKPLLEEETTRPLLLQVTLKKIPKNKNIKMIRVNLPHSIVKDTSDVCLITGDLDKKNRKAEIEPDLLHYKELLNKNGISEISEIITLRQLRTEYRPFEAKLKLLAAYDAFLADSVILECLPKILGSHFFKKRKYPIRINMKAKDLKKEISKAISSKMFYVTGRGNSCTAEIAYLGMKQKYIVANVLSVLQTLAKELPGGLGNILGIYLKTAKSVAVPIYMSNDNPNNVKLPIEMEENQFEIDELTTIPNALVKVYKDGSVETVKNSVIYKSQVEEPKVKENDLESSSPNSDEEVAGQLNCKQSNNDIASQKKVTTKSLTLSEDTSVVETEICDEPDTKKPKKGKRKSQLPISEDNYSAETSVQTSSGQKEFEVCGEADKKKSNKRNRKSTGQLPISEDISSAETSYQTSSGLKEFQVNNEVDTKKSNKKNRKSANRLSILEDIYSAETSIQTNIGLKEFEVCDESDTKKSNKRNRKSVGQLSISEDNCSAEAQISTKGLKVVNEMEEESKNSKKSKRKRTESESEFPIFGKLESKPQFIRSEKKIKLDDSEVKNTFERKQKRNKKKQNQRNVKK